MHESEEWLKQVARGRRGQLPLDSTSKDRLSMEMRKEFLVRVRANRPLVVDPVLSHHLRLPGPGGEPAGE